MGSPESLPPQIRWAIVNKGRALPRVALSSNIGAVSGDRQLGAGRGPGPDRFQGKDPADQVHMADGHDPTEGELRLQEDKPH